MLPRYKSPAKGARPAAPAPPAGGTASQAEQHRQLAALDQSIEARMAQFLQK